MGHWECIICSCEYHAEKPYDTCSEGRTNPDFCKTPGDGE
jgi:hypothetical protein